MSRAAYLRLSGQRATLTEFMQASPLAGLEDEVPLDRPASPTRDIAL